MRRLPALPAVLALDSDPNLNLRFAFNADSHIKPLVPNA
jgi:hypothetical protein